MHSIFSYLVHQTRYRYELFIIFILIRKLGVLTLKQLVASIFCYCRQCGGSIFRSGVAPFLCQFDDTDPERIAIAYSIFGDLWNSKNEQNCHSFEKAKGYWLQWLLQVTLWRNCYPFVCHDSESFVIPRHIDTRIAFLILNENSVKYSNAQNQLKNWQENQSWKK